MGTKGFINALVDCNTRARSGLVLRPCWRSGCLSYTRCRLLKSLGPSGSFLLRSLVQVLHSLVANNGVQRQALTRLGLLECFLGLPFKMVQSASPLPLVLVRSVLLPFLPGPMYRLFSPCSPTSTRRCY
uniref:Uncharacterized protein n=1 Tax=Utricularia reniformis TaxID=192314 RepID=A0A1Y0B3C1_9LAMI|nr:hypothetical protein AEK19_MT1704 [Utricularia reniformis]ART31884.1 hypothetical protein AEK19_MT1704 [Utricularia reniformis]